jgi:hypothetical protein
MSAGASLLARGNHMPKYRKLAFAAALVVGAWLSSTGSALAGNWSPNSASVLGSSTTFAFKVETNVANVFEIITCTSVVLSGTLGNPSAMWTFTPSFTDCADPSEVVGTWKALDINGTTAKMEIPAGGRLAFEVAAGCKVVIGPNTIGANGNYTNGANGLLNPSRWRLRGQTVNITNNPANCYSGAATGVVGVVFNLFNRTNAAEAIKVNP